MVCIGVVTGAHGIRGAVRIKPFTEAPAAVAAYGPVVDESGAALRLRLVGESRDRVLARVAGIDDRTAAEALKGRHLYVPRSALPAPDEEEFYHVDLVGLTAEIAGEDGAGTRSGTVVGVHDHGAGASLEVAMTEGDSILVPFTRDAVPVVDLAGGRLVITALPGLLDEGGQDKQDDG